MGTRLKHGIGADQDFLCYITGTEKYTCYEQVL